MTAVAGAIGGQRVADKGRGALETDVVAEFLAETGLHLVENHLETLHFLKHRIRVTAVDSAELQQRCCQQIALRYLLLHRSELDRLHPPYVRWHKQSRREITAAGMGDGLVETTHQPEWPQDYFCRTRLERGGPVGC